MLMLKQNKAKFSFFHPYLKRGNRLTAIVGPTYLLKTFFSRIPKTRAIPQLLSASL